ncbi:MAG: tetratricopeptide repeat protein [Rhodanobacteraceae bacterium]
MSLIDNLKQRKLVQWAIAYIAFAFALIQALDVVADSYHWPDHAMHIVFGLLVVGFVVALLLAWYHGERGAQRVSGPELLLIALALAIGGGLLWKFGGAAPPMRSPDVAQPNPGEVTPGSAAKAAASGLHSTHAPAKVQTVAIPAKSIAVLPFENLSTDKGNAYFADGMQDLILTKLADIGDLKVISRTSTESYGSHPGNLETIARQLGVATILEGSVQKAGKQVLINVQLIDANTDSHIWAQSYQRTLDNIFGVEGDVATQIANALNAKLTPADTAAVDKIATHNPAALQAFLKAVYFLGDFNRTGDEAELARSVPLAKEAIQEDPNYADAYALLALAYQKLGHYREAEAAARHALALDPGNADAHKVYAFVLVDKGEFDAAIAEARKAVALPSHGAGDIDGLGFTLLYAGRFDEAAKAFERSIEAAPTDNFSRKWLAVVMALRRRYPEARNSLLYVTARNPNDVTAVSRLAVVERLGCGDLAAARKALQSTATPVASSWALSEAWFDLDFAARDYTAAAAVVAAAPATMFDDTPRALYVAQVERAQDDTSKARSAFAAARAQLEARLKAAPDDPYLHANLAQALAGLGDGDAAVTEAKRAVALLPIGHRTLTEPGTLVNLASVYAHTSHASDAIEVLARLLSMPAGMDMSVADLRINPEWDPLRKDPRFQALLKKYSSATPAAARSGTGP